MSSISDSSRHIGSERDMRPRPQRRPPSVITRSERGETIARILARSDLDDFTERVMDSFWDRPELQETRPARDEMRAFVRWNLELVIRWLVDGVPPSDADLNVFRARARVRAAEGTSPDLAPGNFRRGARYAWSALLDAATEDERLALLESADLLFEYVDRVSAIFSEAHEEAARTRPAGAEEAAARSMLRRLVADELPLAEDHLLAERIGFRLDRGAWPFVIACPGRTAQYHAELAGQLRRRGALAVSEGRRVAGLAGTEAPWHGLELESEAIVGSGARAVRTERGLALEELRLVADIAAARGRAGQIAAEDHLAELLLVRSPRVAAKLVARVYAPLSEELAHTLDVLIEHSFERGRAAAALPVHRNTLRDRIARIAELTGLDLDGADGRGLAWLAWQHRRDAISPPPGV